MMLGIIVQLVAAGFSALNVPPSTSRPPCGGLDPSFLRDHDTVCIHLVHHARWLGELVLLNSTATQTVVTQLPATIAVGTDAWWAVRDGMVWGRDTDGGANAHAAIEPFSLTVWYRAACRHAESCPDGNAFFDVGLTVSLRSINTASPVRGEHALIVRIGRSSEQMRSLHWKAEWRRCVLEVTATLLEDAASASPSPTPGPSPITRHISAATAKSKECLGIVPWSNEDERSTYVTMSSPNFNMRNEPTACEQLAKANATNAVHIRYFLAQQAEEIRLFEAAERTLCEPQVVSVSPASLHSSPGFVPDKQVSEAVFQERLQKLLAPYRMSTRLHVHMAFLAKSICSHNAALDRQRATEQQHLQLPSYANGYFNLKHAPGKWLLMQAGGAAPKTRGPEATPSGSISSNSSHGWQDAVHSDDSLGRSTWEHLMTPYTQDATPKSINGVQLWKAPMVMSVAPGFLPEQPDPESDWCPLPILHHEPFNTFESWHVWNVTSYLLRAGAGFCARSADARRKLWVQWRARLEEVMAAHRNNNAFIVYHSAYEAPCSRLKLHAAVRQYEGRPAFSNWQELVVETQEGEERGFTELIEDARRKGSCELANVSALDLIFAFGNDTQLALNMAKALLTQPGNEQLKRANCADGFERDPERMRRISDTIGNLDGAWRMERSGTAFLSKWGAWLLTLATAYHKLVPMCEPADPLYARFGPNDWACTGQVHPTEPDGKIAYDLIPMNKERGYCFGEYCAAAARAIDSYRAFLHYFSHFRTSLVHSMISGQCPYGNTDAESKGGAFLHELVHVRDTLPGLLKQLHAAEPGLTAVCVVPSRSQNDTPQKNWERSKKIIASMNAAASASE